MSEFITFKRWALKDGCQESDLTDLVNKEIAPHYQELAGCLRLGLLHIQGTRSYIALQYWENRSIWQATINSDAYQDWFQAYKPILDRWNRIMTFEEEWECEDILDISSA